MLEAITYEIIKRDMRDKYHGKSKTFGILFVKPNGNEVSQEILNNISFFHHQSGKDFDIYFPGYGAYWGDNFPDAINVCEIGNVQWSFSYKFYTQFIRDMESVSKWKHKAGSELILLDFDGSDVSFNKVVRIRLDKALRDNAIDSVEEFIYKVINIFLKCRNAYSGSDILTLNELGRSIADELKSKFAILRIFQRSKHYTINNYSK